MRTGINPEKLKKTKLTYWKHRVIIPVYIPNLEDEFYKESFKVLKISLNSLFKTINLKQSAITIINNDCVTVVTNYIEELLLNDKIQKHIKYNENLGKVYPILSEVRAVYEEYVTIADADVLYMNNWVGETAKIFNTYSKATMVTPLPCPFNFSYLNSSLIANNFFKLKKDKVIDDYSFNLFLKGVNPPLNFLKGKKWNWRDKQYYLEKKNHKVCPGAMHFFATYKVSDLQKIPLNKPKYVFKNGDETEFIERYLERLGGHRLSTIKTHAYHIGNTIDDWIYSYKFTKQINISFTDGYKSKDRKTILFLFNRLLVELYDFFFKFKN